MKSLKIFTLAATITLCAAPIAAYPTLAASNESDAPAETVAAPLPAESIEADPPESTVKVTALFNVHLKESSDARQEYPTEEQTASMGLVLKNKAGKVYRPTEIMEGFRPKFSEIPAGSYTVEFAPIAGYHVGQGATGSGYPYRQPGETIDLAEGNPRVIRSFYILLLKDPEPADTHDEENASGATDNDTASGSADNGNASDSTDNGTASDSAGSANNTAGAGTNNTGAGVNDAGAGTNNAGAGTNNAGAGTNNAGAGTNNAGAANTGAASNAGSGTAVNNDAATTNAADNTGGASGNSGAGSDKAQSGNNQETGKAHNPKGSHLLAHTGFATGATACAVMTALVAGAALTLTRRRIQK
ncbi:hypothetical protein [Schaalia sp. lx-260]|uniref:hypothetical protein n=1 Tax=Schaalia sp. lx-260 TaxID=2899082 RepID=UPI001E6425D3|nr:hypothetical protein [Schaalia sp. lx-260]MCD4549903.1 hypothetical protein [Schaalia sp. lx-260]